MPPPSTHARRHRALGALLVSLATVLATAAPGQSVSAGPAPRDTDAAAAAAVKRAGRLTVFVGPLRPGKQTRGSFPRGQRVTLQAKLPGLRGKPVLQVKDGRDWQPVKRVEVHTYPELSLFTFKPRAGEQRLRILWRSGRAARATNAARVTVQGRWRTVNVVDGIGVDPGSIRISGDGNVVVHSGSPVVGGGGLYATTRAGATDVILPDGFPWFRSVSDDGRFVFYDLGQFDDAHPLAATTTTYVVDRATKATTPLATWKVYDDSGEQVQFLDASGDGQHVLLERVVDGRLDLLTLRNLATGTEVPVYAPTAEERAGGVHVRVATLSDDASTIAFGVGPGAAGDADKNLSVRVWHSATGVALPAAASSRPHVLGSVGGIPVLQLSDDGTRLLYDHGGRLRLLDVPGGTSTTIPLKVEIGVMQAVQLAGNGAAVLMDSGVGTGVYQVAMRRWSGLEDDPQLWSIADDGRTMAYTTGLAEKARGLRLLVAP